jgi:hypothetical protein
MTGKLALSRGGVFGRGEGSRRGLGRGAGAGAYSTNGLSRGLGNGGVATGPGGALGNGSGMSAFKVLFPESSEGEVAEPWCPRLPWPTA